MFEKQDHAPATASAAIFKWELGRTPDIRGTRQAPYLDLIILGLLPRDRSALDLAALYKARGAEMGAGLTGAFSFAVWDGQAHRLLCVRDHFGQAPNYYFADATRFAWSTDRRALLDALAVRREPDETAIAQFLTGRYVEHVRTEYRGLHRLAPAHALVVHTPRNVETRCYWRPPHQDAVCTRPAEHLRDLMFDAVSRAMSQNAAGVALSGGLDSSSIAVIARQRAAPARTVATFSYVFDQTPLLSERTQIESVLKGGGFAPHFIPASGYSAFADFSALIEEQDGLAPALGLTLARKLYAAAAENGHTTLLDGHGGDEIISHGLGRLQDLARDRQWASLWRESQAAAHLYGDHPVQTFASHALAASWRWRALIKTKRRLFDGPRERTLRRLGSYGDLLNRDFAASHALALAPNEAPTREGSTEFVRHSQAIQAPLQMIAFETLFNCARTFGVTPAYPFWDRALVEFCLTLPAAQKMRGGYSKLILRRAMRGLLPEDIRRRRDKFNFLPHAISAMLIDQTAISHRLHDKSSSIGDFVDLGVVGASFTRIKAQRDAAHGRDVRIVWRAIALSYWLEHVQRRNGALQALTREADSAG